MLGNQRVIVGVDIGGTKINIGKIKNGVLSKEIRLPTKPQRPDHEIMDDIINGIKKVIDPEVIGIGIGVPGLVDEENGVAYNLLNIPSWLEVNLKAVIESALNLPVFISNDANCFALGEKVFGKGKEFSNLVGITMGTGVGAGIIANDGLCSGTLSLAGEVGGMPYLDHDYEYYCSGKFFTREFQHTAKEVYDKAGNDDKVALTMLSEFGHHVGNLIKIVMLAYGPEAIILGGSVAKAYKFFYNSMMDTVDGFPYKRILKRIKIMDFTSEKIPLMGAAALVLTKMNKKPKINASYEG